MMTSGDCVITELFELPLFPKVHPMVDSATNIMGSCCAFKALENDDGGNDKVLTVPFVLYHPINLSCKEFDETMPHLAR
eukprot:11040793-Ditylum_brightwellii.AAC.1